MPAIYSTLVGYADSRSTRGRRAGAAHVGARLCSMFLVLLSGSCCCCCCWGLCTAMCGQVRRWRGLVGGDSVATQRPVAWVKIEGLCGCVRCLLGNGYCIGVGRCDVCAAFGVLCALDHQLIAVICQTHPPLLPSSLPHQFHHSILKPLSTPHTPHPTPKKNLWHAETIPTRRCFAEYNAHSRQQARNGVSGAPAGQQAPERRAQPQEASDSCW